MRKAIRSILPHYTSLLIIGLGVLLLLFLSWPRLQASIRYLPVDTAMSKYWQSREADNAQLEALAERAREAIDLYDHYRYWEGLGELLVLSGQDMARPYWQRRQLLEQARVAATEVVRRAPAKPRAWLRIARTGAYLGRGADEIIPAWKMSILTGRVEPTLMLTRLDLGLQYFGVLDDDARVLLRDQLVLTWAVQKRAILKGLKTGSLDIVLVSEVLDGRHNDILAEMKAG